MLGHRKELIKSGRRIVGAGEWMILLSLVVAMGLSSAAYASGTDPGGGTGGAGEDDGLYSGPGRSGAYREAVLRVKEEYHLPGVVAGVWVPGKEPWRMAEGLADVASGRQIGLDDHFPIRSTTKSLTVTLVLKLARRGAISLEDPIGKYVPDIPNGNEITLAHLAAMESGVKSYSDVKDFTDVLEVNPEKHWTPDELVGIARRHSPVFPPGTQYEYSNTNCILLGIVLEKVTGEPLAELYRKWIFRPLGLKGTSYPDSTDIPSPHPSPYIVDSSTGEPLDCPIVNLSAFGASGGMVSTLQDLHRWGKALGKGTLIGPRLQKVRLQHSRPATGGPEYDRYGLGIGQLKGWWGHTGEGLGHQAAVFYDPKSGAVIAVLINSSQRVNVAAEVFKALADVVHPPAK